MLSLNRKYTESRLASHLRAIALVNSLKMGAFERLTFVMSAFGISLFSLSVSALPAIAAAPTNQTLLQSTAETIPASQA